MLGTFLEAPQDREAGLPHESTETHGQGIVLILGRDILLGAGARPCSLNEWVMPRAPDPPVSSSVLR